MVMKWHNDEMKYMMRCGFISARHILIHNDSDDRKKINKKIML